MVSFLEFQYLSMAAVAQVLPQPGPPVSTLTWLVRHVLMAWRCPADT
jgi:hypothetical protein